MSKNTWILILEKQAEKVLRKLPKDLIIRIDRKLKELETSPYPEGCKKLSGYDHLYRVRMGDWRIIYAVEEDRLIILILEIAPRGGAYKNL
jgi:mRNA interferase RelE/StbE